MNLFPALHNHHLFFSWAVGFFSVFVVIAIVGVAAILIRRPSGLKQKKETIRVFLIVAGLISSVLGLGGIPDAPIFGHDKDISHWLQTEYGITPQNGQFDTQAMVNIAAGVGDQNEYSFTAEMKGKMQTIIFAKAPHKDGFLLYLLTEPLPQLSPDHTAN